MPFLGFLVVGAVNLGANLADYASSSDVATHAANISQYLLMPLLALAVWRATPAPRGHCVRWTLLALGFSWLGDSAPDLTSGDAAFLVMMGCFLVTQLCYIAAFWPARRHSLAVRPWALAAAAVVLIALVAACAQEAGPLLGPVIAYGLCLVMMVLLASGIDRLAGVGGLLFLISDALIALRAFNVTDPPASGFWVMLTYIAGQMLIAAGVVRQTFR